jgi:hypothetical protein
LRRAWDPTSTLARTSLVMVASVVVSCGAVWLLPRNWELWGAAALGGVLALAALTIRGGPIFGLEPTDGDLGGSPPNQTGEGPDSTR